MEKMTFINSFSEYDKNYMSNIYDNIVLCKKTHNTVFTKEFLIPYIYNKLSNMSNELGVKVYCYGVYEDSERKIVAFDLYEKPEEFPVDLIKVTNKSKFKNLSHKDYLGSLMALGLKREVFGDLVVEDDHCYVPAVRDITNYILGTLETIGHCPCELEILKNNPESIPKVKFQEKVIIFTSLRLDNIVSGICNLSRNESNSLISGGFVMINHITVSKKDKLVKPQDIITIRGHGKFRVQDIIGETHKSRLKVLIRKYT
ncbi:RNA-binding protein [Clostridium tunisiense]|uniref:YlmH family RNA-binding protein n=1 Tax=Clostridium tunisiense TaxID=219748 RepID=UPI0002D3ADA0|nr:YlmH/Sll1252 family protein [Clostridium tunisiense]